MGPPRPIPFFNSPSTCFMNTSPSFRRALLLTLFATATGAARAQNVGVGTLTPSEKLDVVGGNLKLSTAGSRLIFPDGTFQTTAASGTGTGSFILNAPASQQTGSFNLSGNGTLGGTLTTGGTVVVDNADSNTGTTANFLRFGSGGSGEGIGSKRNAGGNQYGLDFYTSSANRMTITNAGRVGIGTTSPAGGLHVNTGGAGIGSGSPGVVLNGAPNDYPMMELRGGTTAVAPYIDFAETSAVDFSTRLQSAGGTLYVSNTGAATALSVNGGAAVTGSATVGNNLQITNNLAVDNAAGNTGTIGNALRFGGFSGEGIGSKRSSGGNQYGLDFYTSSAARMSITGSGNVGIGTSAPNAPLQLGNTLANRKLVLYESANNDHEFLGFGINGNTLRYQVANGGDNHVFFSGSSATTSRELMRISGSGNVGIGTATPATALDVTSGAGTQLTITSTAGDPNGVIAITVPNTPACAGCSELIQFSRAGYGVIGSITMNAAGTGINYVNTSDKRLKEHIGRTRFGLADLLKLEVKDYNFIGQPASQRNTGFLAQDLFKVYPEAVKEGDYGTTVTNQWGVDYGKLTPLLVQAIQDQQALIVAQQAELDALKQQNAALQTGSAADHASLLSLQAQVARLLGEGAQARK
jgi:hypothetical protein